MIQLRQTLERARDLLSAANIDFALIGGFALAAYGIHRATRDIDLLVDGEHKFRVKTLFVKAGFRVYHETQEFLQFDQPSFLDILFANRPLSLAMLKKASTGLRLAEVPVVSKEGLIGLKIQAYKNDPKRELQDKADIQALLRLKPVDMKQVKDFAELFGAWEEIERLCDL